MGSALLRLIRCALLTIIAADAAHAQNASAAFVAPSTTIEMGQVIKAEQLTLRNAELPAEAQPHVFRTIPDVAGTIARRRLPPDQPIRVDAVRGRPIFPVGATVLMRFAKYGITIDTVGLALQNGSVGERVRVKNISTSVIVQGVVGIDGVIYVPNI